MKKTSLLFIVFSLVFSLSEISFAVRANPNIIKETQPDGTEINIKLFGDEFYSWYEDLDGYTVMKNTKNNTWSYAKQNDFGDLEPSEDLVGKVKPINLNIRKYLRDENKFFKANQNRAEHNAKLAKTLALYKSSNTATGNLNKAQTNYASATGTKTNFVLLIQFKDLKFNERPPFKNSTDSQIIAAFDNLYNKTGYASDGAVGSVKDYFNEVSYGKLKYNSVISPIIEIEQSYKDFAWSLGEATVVPRIQEMIKNALIQLDKRYDFKALWPNTNKPDGFSVVHAGGGAESGNFDFIWSHKSEIDKTTLDGIEFSNYHIEPAGRGKNGDQGLIRIGVICHESLHFFGLPDLYDTTYSTGGLGDFCIMSGGEWNGADGVCPAHPSAWCKYELGWINCQRAVVGTNSIGESATQDDAFYKFAPSSFPAGEYFLMENRQNVGFDKEIPGSKRGILIYHIDENKKGNSLIYGHYKVQIEEAGSGTSNWAHFPCMHGPDFNGTDNDYFRNNTVSYFNDDCSSSPNSKSYEGKLSGIKISEISSSSSLMTFAYGKEVVIVDDLSNVVCFPNPARQGYINIINLPTILDEFSVEIFTLTSKLIRSYSVDDTEYTDDGFRKIKWDCKNSEGEDVAPGVYLIMVKNNSKKKIFKVAVIR